MPKPNGLNKCLTAFDQDSTLVAVVEMSQSSWLVAGVVPGIERQPLKKLKPDEQAQLMLLHRWRNEALKAGRDHADHVGLRSWPRWFLACPLA